MIWFIIASTLVIVGLGGLASATQFATRTRRDEASVAGEAQRLRGVGRGQMAILCVGSYAAGILPQLLTTCIRAGTARVIGPILLLEPDRLVRDECRSLVPQEFYDHLVVASLPNFPIGMSSAPIGKVQALREEWARDVQETALRWIEAIKAGSENGVLVAFLSPGGSAALGADAVEAYRREWPWKKVYGATILDEKTAVRRRFGDLLSLYDPLLDGLIVNDNRRNSAAADAALCMIFGAAPAARFIADRPADLWNVLAQVHDKHRFATVSAWGTTLPVQFRGSLSKRPVTKRRFVEEAAKAGVHAVIEDPLRQSLPTPAAGLSHMRFALFGTSVAPRHLRACARTSREDLEPWRSHSDPDLIIEFAPVMFGINTNTMTAPAYVGLLQPVAASARELASLADGQAPIDPSFCPPPPPGLLDRRPRRLLSADGHVAPALVEGSL